ncbi:MAG: hypothetical protein ACTSPV_19200 [Candidatus Hodarchaeales archaeon]
MALEYLMLYRRSGLPIYSKCYQGFCKVNAQDPALLSGFLSALETFSLNISGTNDTKLEAIKMGNTIMRFSRTLPKGHSIVVGLSEDNEKLANDIFNAVSDLLEKRFKDVDWDLVTTDFSKEFEKALLEDVLIPELHDYGGFEDNCPLGDKCPMKTLPHYAQQKKSIWSNIKSTYQGLWSRMKKMK